MLQDAQICWKPDLGDGDDDGPGVLRMFRQWAKRYLATGDLMKRLDVGEGTYGREIEEDYDVMFAFSELQVSLMGMCRYDVHDSVQKHAYKSLLIRL